MEVELFGELVVLLEHFWHRYVERPPASKFSPGTSVDYAAEGEKALQQLWRFCLAINFLQLGRLTMKKLIKSRFAVEYQLATGHWNWLRTGGLGLKQRQHIRVQLRQYVEQFQSGLSHPQSVSFYLSTSAKRIRYIHGFARALYFPERLCSVFFLTELGAFIFDYKWIVFSICHLYCVCKVGLGIRREVYQPKCNSYRNRRMLIQRLFWECKKSSLSRVSTKAISVYGSLTFL